MFVIVAVKITMMMMMIIIITIIIIIKFCSSVITGLSMATSHIPACFVHSLFLNFFVYIYLLFVPDVTFSYTFR